MLNFTTPAAAPTATTNAATSVGGTAATLNGSANAEDSTMVTDCDSMSSLTNCVGGTVTTVNGSTPMLTGSTTTAETAGLTGHTPNTEYFFQIKAVNSVTTTYGAAQLHYRVGPDRHHERGQRDDGHRLDVDAGQRGELIYHG